MIEASVGDILNLLIEFIRFGIDFILHIDAHLNQLAASLGPWLYVVLFLIVFCETGLVVTPFLPGDSLLFAVGALAATEGSVINIWAIWALLFAAAVIGDAVNYSVGKYFGPRVFKYDDSWWLNKEHLVRTQKFYEKHGGKTIIWARFIPIVRTFAPFVAGIGHMQYRRFGFFNITGAFLWVTSFLVLGNLFGNLPVVKTNFHYVLIGIVLVSVLPVVIEYFRTKKIKRAQSN